MTELSLYSFIEAVVNVIPAVQNRFAVLEGYGNDLNADNNDETILGNSVSQPNFPKKYPCAAMMPPREISRNKKNSTTRFLIKIYFLTTSYNQSTGGIKNLNKSTNTSKQSIKEDWSEMKQSAEDFMRTMTDSFYADISILQYIRPVKSSSETYDRISLANNDRLSGVSLTFELDVVMSCNGGGNAPAFTPPTTCGVCNPDSGSPNQVWSISADGLTVGWRTISISGGGGIANFATQDDSNFAVIDGTGHTIPNNTFSSDKVVDVSGLTTECEIYNGRQNFRLIFTGADVYAFGGSEIVTECMSSATTRLRNVQGKIIIIN